LLIISLFFTCSAQADVYKSVDEDGNVVFTDKPSPDAEKIIIKEVQTIEAPKVQTNKEALPEAEEEKLVGYSKVAIIHPQNGTGIRANDGNITITTTVEPALDNETGDTLALYMDNKLVSTGSSTKFSLNNVDRGTHNFSVAVVDKDGKELIRSASISFSVLRK
jgi:ribosomal protein L24